LVKINACGATASCMIFEFCKLHTIAEIILFLAWLVAYINHVRIYKICRLPPPFTSYVIQQWGAFFWALFSPSIPKVLNEQINFARVRWLLPREKTSVYGYVSIIWACVIKSDCYLRSFLFQQWTKGFSSIYYFYLAVKVCTYCKRSGGWF